MNGELPPDAMAPNGEGLGQSMGKNNRMAEDKRGWKFAWGHGTQLALTELWSHCAGPSCTKSYLNFHIFLRAMVTFPFDRCVSRETRTRTQVSWLPVVLFLIHTTENPATNLQIKCFSSCFHFSFCSPSLSSKPPVSGPTPWVLNLEVTVPSSMKWA